MNSEINPPRYAKQNDFITELVKIYAATRLPEPMTELRRGGLIPTSEVHRMQKVTLAGSLTWVNGLPAREYEYCAKNIDNRVFAVWNRHLAS